MRKTILMLAIASIAVIGAEKNRGGGVGKKSRGASTNMTISGGTIGVRGHGGSGVLRRGGSCGVRIATSGGSTNGRA